jgi:hypothetical protein
MSGEGPDVAVGSAEWPVVGAGGRGGNEAAAASGTDRRGRPAQCRTWFNSV